MKKTMYLFLVAFLSLVACDNHDDVQHQILFDELPNTAQTFITTHFSGVEVSSVLKEREGLLWEYKVSFVNGTWVDFDAKGNWEQVTSYQLGVPNSVVPTPILTYVQTNYPSNKIVQIDNDNNGYDVELDSGVELEFNKSGVLIEVNYN